MKPRTNRVIKALIVVGIIQVSFSAMSETGRVVTRITLGGAQIFELVHHKERAFEKVVPNDPKIFDLRKLAPSSAFATNDVYTGWIRSNTNGVGVPVWTNSQPTFEGLPSAQTPFSLLAVQTRSNELFLCYKLGPLVFGEGLGFRGNASAMPHFRALLYRDSPLSPSRTMTNATFVVAADSAPELTTSDSFGTDYGWQIRDRKFVFAFCKTNAPVAEISQLPKIRLSPPENWIWVTNGWVLQPN